MPRPSPFAPAVDRLEDRLTPAAGDPLLVGVNRVAVGPDVGGSPTARVIDTSGTQLSAPTAFLRTFTGGVRTAEADFNADGTPDTVVASGPGATGLVRVIDGATGSELFNAVPFEAAFGGGLNVAAGDVDGDGRADLVVSPDQGGGPRVKVYTGNGFTLLADFFGIDDPAFRGGARVAVGDLTGDGSGDVAVAAGFGGGPRLAVFDGAQLAAGNQVRAVGDRFVFDPSLRNGTYVALGDVNGDDRADLVVGAGPGGGPRLLVLDGRSLQAGAEVTVADFFAGDPAARGGVRVAVKDADGDANADLVTAAGRGVPTTANPQGEAFGSTVFLYNGADLVTGVTDPDQKLDPFSGFGGGVFVG